MNRLADRKPSQSRHHNSGNNGDTLPPHDEEAEAGALGCVLYHGDDESAGMLSQLTIEDFYVEAHREVFRVLQALASDRKPLSQVALTQSLRDLGKIDSVGGLAYIANLPEKAISPANFPTFLEVLKDLADRRSALRDGTALCQIAADRTLPARSIPAAATRMLETYAAKTQSAEGLTLRRPDELLSMRFDDSDRILGDRLMATGQSLVIAGAGSIGKSRILLQLAVATIIGRRFVGFESRNKELRWLVLQAENSNRRLQNDLAAVRDWAGQQDWPRVNANLAIHTLESEVDGFLSLDNVDTQRRIAEAVRRIQPDVVAFDSLYNFGIGDLNKDEDMAATLLTLTRLSKAGNPNRMIVVLHHALTGRAGAARATGYDRSSHGRNSKVLFAWTRAQLNIAPGSPDSNQVLVLSCGKCSNGKEFPSFAIQMNPETMIYEEAPDFDLKAWEEDVSGKREHRPVMTNTRVRELCRLPMSKGDLAKAIIEDCGCARATAYRHVCQAVGRTIRHNKASDTYVAK